MRYFEIIEAARASRVSKALEKRRRAHGQIAAADRKRADAARKYRVDVDRAHEAEQKAKAELRRASTGEGARDTGGDVPLFERTVCHLRDRNGVPLGTLHPVGRILQAKDRQGAIVGWYDPRTDQTRDRTGHIVGSGDLLAALIMWQRR
jgi:hypothetical protein